MMRLSEIDAIEMLNVTDSEISEILEAREFLGEYAPGWLVEKAQLAAETRFERQRAAEIDREYPWACSCGEQYRTYDAAANCRKCRTYLRTDDIREPRRLEAK